MQITKAVFAFQIKVINTAIIFKGNWRVVTPHLNAPQRAQIMFPTKELTLIG